VAEDEVHRPAGIRHRWIHRSGRRTRRAGSAAGRRPRGSDRLVFAGKVGTGFTQASAQALRTQLDALEQSDCPFTPRPVGRLDRVHWVRPRLVAAVTFTEWTADGKIRHPSFQGLRADKRASEVIRERPAALSRG